MFEVIKIGLRNLVKNRKKTIFICIAVFISLYLLLLSNAFVNGMQKTITNAYINIQSGDVPVMWEDHYDVSTLIPGKFVNPNTTKTFNVEKDEENKKAIKRLDTFLKDNIDKVDFCAKIVRRTAKFEVDDTSYSVIVYGLEEKDKNVMEYTNTFGIESGEWPSKKGEIAISEERADTCNLAIGDTIKLNGRNVDNEEIDEEFTIKGIYKNGAQYNNYYAVMTPEGARDFFKMDNDMFDMAKIFLKNQDDSNSFAAELDDYLTEDSTILRAQDYYDAGLFFTALSPLLKTIYKGFVVVLLLVISVGLRAVIRLNIYSSLKEFGIMRAIGFSKLKCFWIVFIELFAACMISLLAALSVVGGFVIGFANKGLYIGTNFMTNAFGGEYLYFILKPSDYVFAIIVMLIFILISTIPPIVKMCNVKITNLLNKQLKAN